MHLRRQQELQRIHLENDGEIEAKTDFQLEPY